MKLFYTRGDKDMKEKKVDVLYDTAVHFTRGYGEFDAELLKKAFQTDSDTISKLIDELIYNGAIVSSGRDGYYVEEKSYNHSEYLLSKEIEEQRTFKGEG